MPVYTTIPIPKQQLASDSFRTRKIGSEAPTPVYESRVSIMSAKAVMKITMFFQFLWAFTASKLLSAQVSVTTFVNALASPTPELFVPTPPLMVTFREYNETVRGLLNELGFSLQSSGRYKYAKGPASDTAVRRLTEAGGAIDAYSLAGACNIKGYAAFTIIIRLLHASLGFMVLDESEIPELWKMEKVTDGLWENYLIKGAHNTPKNGILFPYFDGMVLPDKAGTPRTLLAIFSKCMGRQPQELRTASRTLMEGWPSLSTTSAGLILSHLVFGLHLAVTGTAQLRPVVIGGVYMGFVLSGSAFIVLKGGVEHSILSKEKLSEEISELDGHNQAIITLCEIISSAAYYEDSDKKVDVLPEHLTSARRVHYALRIRQFDVTQQNDIVRLLGKLRFQQTFWDKSNDGKVAQVIETMLGQEWLPADAPYYIMSGNVFSRSHVLSALAAFGDKSISLIGFGNNTTLTLSKNTKKSIYETADKVKLEGVPLFFKPLVECYNEWESLMKTGVITMKTGMKDKKGMTKVAGIGTWVVFSSPSYEKVVRCLADKIAGQIGKRKDRGSMEEGDGLDKEPSAKKIRIRKSENEGVLGLFGLNPVLPEAEAEEGEEMNTDPFA